MRNTFKIDMKPAEALLARTVFVYAPLISDMRLRRLCPAVFALTCPGPRTLWDRLVFALTFAALDLHFMLSGPLDREPPASPPHRLRSPDPTFWAWAAKHQEAI